MSASLAVQYETRLGPSSFGGVSCSARDATNQQCLVSQKFKENDKNRGSMSLGTRRLDSSVNWDSDSQRKFWNAWDTQRLQTVGEETRRRGDEVLGLISSLNLERPRILEIACGNGWLAERLLSFGPVTGGDIADAAIQEARRRVPSA